MQELRQEAPDRKKSKSKIGTIYSESLNYPKQIPAFDASHIPARAKQIKSEIKLTLLPDILSTKPAKWNPSVLFDSNKPYPDQVSLSQLHFEIRKGIRDVSLPRPTYSKIYEGVDTRNEASNWNISVQFDENEHKKNHLKVNQSARTSSAKRNREILENKKYVKPFVRQVQLIRETREAKVNDLEVKSEKIKEIQHENPNVSREKAVALVNKMISMQREKGAQDEFYGVKKESFKPDLKETVKKRVVRKSRHDGVFQFNEGVEKMIWSCCANEDQNSSGCIVTYKDMDRWQMLSA